MLAFADPFDGLQNKSGFGGKTKNKNIVAFEVYLLNDRVLFMLNLAIYIYLYEQRAAENIQRWLSGVPFKRLSNWPFADCLVYSWWREFDWLWASIVWLGRPVAYATLGNI